MMKKLVLYVGTSMWEHGLHDHRSSAMRGDVIWYLVVCLPWNRPEFGSWLMMEKFLAYDGEISA